MNTINHFDRVREYFEKWITVAVSTPPPSRDICDLTITTPIQLVRFENDGANDLDPSKSAEPWLALTIREGDGFAVSIGPEPVRRYVGICIVSIYAPKGQGTGEIRKIASALSTSILKRNTLPKICKEQRESELKEDEYLRILARTGNFAIIGESDRWFQGNLTIPFEFDVITGE